MIDCSGAHKSDRDGKEEEAGTTAVVVSPKIKQMQRMPALKFIHGNNRHGVLMRIPSIINEKKAFMRSSDWITETFEHVVISGSVDNENKQRKNKGTNKRRRPSERAELANSKEDIALWMLEWMLKQALSISNQFRQVAKTMLPSEEEEKESNKRQQCLKRLESARRAPSNV